jgi:DNA-directed RNA polymerase subunit beta
LESNILCHLNKSRFVLLGSWVETTNVLVGKMTPHEAKESLHGLEGKSLQAIFGIQVAIAREICLKVPMGGKGRVIDVKWIYQKDNSINHEKIGTCLYFTKKINTSGW